ncbi:hypothetical protein [Dyadobacter bucti]|uniref:hypothetical protein n=1 Tax=Dyadobacter bucti TaxID=2572203 RepID=UPI001407AF41|nr:hypothetical protein [Dyadobacter bucti]
MTITNSYLVLARLYQEGKKPNVEHSLLMNDARQLISLNEEVQKLADEVSKPRREGHSGARPVGAYHLIHELGQLLDAMKQKYQF